MSINAISEASRAREPNRQPLAAPSSQQAPFGQQLDGVQSEAAKAAHRHSHSWSKAASTAASAAGGSRQLVGGALRPASGVAGVNSGGTAATSFLRRL